MLNINWCILILWSISGSILYSPASRRFVLSTKSQTAAPRESMYSCLTSCINPDYVFGPYRSQGRDFFSRIIIMPISSKTRFSDPDPIGYFWIRITFGSWVRVSGSYRRHGFSSRVMILSISSGSGFCRISLDPDPAGHLRILILPDISES